MSDDFNLPGIEFDPSNLWLCICMPAVQLDKSAASEYMVLDDVQLNIPVVIIHEHSIDCALVTGRNLLISFISEFSWNRHYAITHYSFI